jgi:uncharacterized protein (DUF305 family)
LKLLAFVVPLLVGTQVVAQTKGYTKSDVEFMQGMIGHHAQAMEMAAMVASRTSREEMKSLAERITISQRDEIARMKRWLNARKEQVPADDAHMHAAMGHGELMPGMLTQDELNKLMAAKGVQFDRLFLQGMIKHHEGALTMVEKLHQSPGAGQEPELYLFATDVDADQRAEIKRMKALLAALNTSK